MLRLKVNQLTLKELQAIEKVAVMVVVIEKDRFFQF